MPDGPRDAVSVKVPIFPTGVLSGGFSRILRSPLPDAFAATFRSSPTQGVATVSTSSAICPVREQKWHCELPAIDLDMQLSLAGYASHFVWGIRVPVGGEATLPPFPLDELSSVVGWVRSEGKTLSESLRVSLLADGADEAGRAPYVSFTNPKGRGFFQFTGIRPGRYVVRTQARSGGVAATAVQVDANQEVLIRDPLTLAEAATLRLSVDPPTTPDGAPWRIELLTGGQSAMAVVRDSQLTPSGKWIRAGLAAGDYRLGVLDAANNRWRMEEVELQGGVNTFDLTIRTMMIRGTISLGDRPVEATLTFGGQGSESMRVRSAEDGTFMTTIPQGASLASADGWEVDVEATNPPIRRSVGRVLPRVVNDSESIVDIVLPDTKLSGHVVDQLGEPVSRPLVRVQSLDTLEPFVQIQGNESGMFEFRGIPPGRVVLGAESDDGRSDDLQVVVSERAEGTDPKRLILRRLGEVTGVIRSRGIGVAGAAIRAFPAENPLMPVPMRVSGADGPFTVKAPEGTKDLAVNVAADGFALHIGRTTLESGTSLAIELVPTGGTLRLSTPLASVPPTWDRPAVYLLRDGSYESLAALRRWGYANGSSAEGSSEVVIARLEPGRYTACVALISELPGLLTSRNPGPDCVSGTLREGGELTLTLGDRRAVSP